MPEISVIIPIKDEPEALQTSLDHLFPCIETYEYEVIIANDGGNSDVEVLANDYSSAGKNIRIISWPEPKGAYFARNRAIEKATGKKLLFLDSDLHFDCEAVRLTLKQLEKFSYAGPDVKIKIPHNPSIWQRYYALVAFNNKKFIKQHGFLITAFLGIRAEIFNKYGLFEEKPQSGGDFEIAQRISGAEKKFLPEISVYHATKSLYKQAKTAARDFYGLKVYHRKHPGNFKRKINLYFFIRHLYHTIIDLKTFPKNYFKWYEFPVLIPMIIYYKILSFWLYYNYRE